MMQTNPNDEKMGAFYADVVRLTTIARYVKAETRPDARGGHSYHLSFSWGNGKTHQTWVTKDDWLDSTTGKPRWRTYKVSVDRDNADAGYVNLANEFSDAMECAWNELVNLAFNDRETR